MSDERWRRLRALFDEVQELPEAERSAFLDRELAGDPELRGEIDQLLRDELSATEFLVAPDAAPDHGRVGPFRLLRILGEGGFGVVYLAEQEHPIRRRVALKLIKPGMDTKLVIARFEAERQALALMDHPGIAQVFEAGATETGRPYFAMEYVPGVSVTSFCDEERLRIPERLHLFLQVCDAIQHAHHKGVIHRDIKPSNVIVTMRDGVPAPKVIDFGIVKATTDATTGGTLMMTREGVIVGTLGYMSPEQAGAADAVDVRSDIYSLGVLLYELLAGAPPFDAERLKKAALSDAVHIIRAEEPPTMTARVAKSGEAVVTETAGLRSTDTRRFLRELKGELQWITLRAMEKDPDRRYASAAELAADIRRYLAQEPVLAGAPSTMYRLRKYARRHRVGVAAALLVLAAIVSGGIAAAVGFSRAVRAEQAARREAESSKQVADFLVQLFRASSPTRSKGEVVTAKTLLDEGTRRMKTALQNDPLVRARVLDAMSGSYVNLGEYEEGIRLAREALAAAESVEPQDGREVARRLAGLAQALSIASQLDSIPAILDRAVSVLKASGETDNMLLASCYNRKAQWWNLKGEGGLADSMVTMALDLAEAEPDPDLPQLMRMHSTKANIAHRRFDLPVAERHYLRALELAEQTDDPTFCVYLHRRLASVYRALGDSDKAIAHADAGVKQARQIYAPDHPNLADALGGQADALIAQHRFTEAIVVRKEALGIQRARGTPDGVAYELNALGVLYRTTGQIDLAIASAEEAYKVRREDGGSKNPLTAEALANLARCYADANMTTRADAAFLQAIDTFRHLDSRSIFAIDTDMAYANFCRDAGRAQRADSFYVRAEAALDSTSTATRSFLGMCRVDHGYLRALQGRHEEAESMMRSGLPMQRGDGPENSADLKESYVLWAAARARAGSEAGAIEQLTNAARCGATNADVAKYSELASLQTRPDYPLDNAP